jgi:hypothetical protein
VVIQLQHGGGGGGGVHGKRTIIPSEQHACFPLMHGPHPSPEHSDATIPPAWNAATLEERITLARCPGTLMIFSSFKKEQQVHI